MDLDRKKYRKYLQGIDNVRQYLLQLNSIDIDFSLPDLELSPDQYAYVIDYRTRSIPFHRNFVELMGFKEEEITFDLVSGQRYNHPQDYPTVSSYIGDLFNCYLDNPMGLGEFCFQSCYRVRNAEGDERHILRETTAHSEIIHHKPFMSLSVVTVLEGFINYDGVRLHLSTDDQFSKAFFSSLKEKNRNKLTPREKEVAHWVSEGKSSVEIADILGLSPHTIRSVRKHLLHKTNTDNSVAMVQFLKAVQWI